MISYVDKEKSEVVNLHQDGFVPRVGDTVVLPLRNSNYADVETGVYEVTSLVVEPSTWFNDNRQLNPGATDVTVYLRRRENKMSRDVSLQRYRDFYEKNELMKKLADEVFDAARQAMLDAGFQANNTDPAEDFVDAIVKYVVASNMNMVID